MLRDVLRHEWRKPAAALPRDEMRRIGRYRDIGRVDAARLLLADALEDALRTGALHAHGDPRILRLESFRELFGERQIERGIESNLSLAARRLDQRVVDCGRR